MTTTRVPNVSPTARSGLLGKALGTEATDLTHDDPAAAAPREATDPGETGGVPDGTVEDVLAWVDAATDAEDRRARAQAAKQAEGSDGRVTLLDALEVVLGDSEPADPQGEPDTDALTVPEDVTTVEGILEWVTAADTDTERTARAEAALTAEHAREEDDRRVTLLEPLQQIVDASADGDDT
ncbi:hypothetical protein Pam4_41 [Pseudanabaena phage Pam4]|nr:hypothetical protein Pam4_41 [Pseudanabaena phage Pam4]